MMMSKCERKDRNKYLGVVDTAPRVPTTESKRILSDPSL